MGVSKFASENSVDPVEMMKVAGLGKLIGNSFNSASKNLGRLGNSLATGGIRNTAGKIYNKAKNTVGDAFSTDHAKATLKNRQKPIRESLSLDTTTPAERLKALRDAGVSPIQGLENVQNAARKNVALGAGGLAGAGYGAGVAKDYYDMANMQDEYEMDWLQKLKMMLGMQKPSSVFSPLNPFAGGYRGY